MSRHHHFSYLILSIMMTFDRSFSAVNKNLTEHSYAYFKDNMFCCGCVNCTDSGGRLWVWSRRV